MSDVITDPTVVLVLEETITHTWSGSLSQLPIDFQNAWDEDAQEWNEAGALSIFSTSEGMDRVRLLTEANTTSESVECVESYHEV